MQHYGYAFTTPPRKRGSRDRGSGGGTGRNWGRNGESSEAHQTAVGDLIDQLIAGIDQEDWSTVLGVALQLLLMGAATLMANGNIKVNQGGVDTEINATTGEVVGSWRPNGDDGNGNGGDGGDNTMLIVGGLALLFLFMQQ